MATIDELEARAANVKATEAAALCALADAMRALAVWLPDRSPLAIEFARRAKTLESFAGCSSPGLWGGTTTTNFVRDRRRERVEAED